MNNIKNKIWIAILVTNTCLFFIQAPAQDNKPVKSRMSLEYYKISGDRILKVAMKAKEGRQYVFLTGISIDAKILADTLSIDVGTANTNKDGVASFLVSDELFDQYNNDGLISFESSFSGSEKYKPSSDELVIKDLNLNLTFAQEDEKNIILTAFNEIEDERSPVSEDIEISFYVPRTFTLFQIGSKTLENGKAVIPFPVDLPGDTLGNMEVIAKIEEHDLYGNVEIAGSINWGLPQEKVVSEERGLGDTNAPLWMVYTLIVLLSIVWFHYLWVIRSIYLIKRESKKAIAEKLSTQ